MIVQQPSLLVLVMMPSEQVLKVMLLLLSVITHWQRVLKVRLDHQLLLVTVRRPVVHFLLLLVRLRKPLKVKVEQLLLVMRLKPKMKMRPQ